MEENRVTEEATEKSGWKQEVWDWIKSILWAVVIVGLVFGFVIRPVEVDGSSMEPTLQDGDRLIVYRLLYTPKQGDVVILDENSGLNEALVKRVIATEGQTVNIDENGYVKVDGLYLDEPYILEPIEEGRHGSHTYPVEVPEGCIFVMGDNRNHSTDSRFPQVGFVSTEDVVGKVVFRILPVSSFGTIH